MRVTSEFSAVCPALLLLLWWTGAVAAGRNGGGHRRPSPSQDLSIVDLIEPADTKYDPKPEDMDYRFLKEKLGHHFDPTYMSVQRPLDSLLHPNGTLELAFRKTKRGELVPSGKMPPELRRLKLRPTAAGHPGRLGPTLPKRTRRKFKQMLWALTYCPVAFKWKDLGLRFWPRWIREGSCSHGGQGGSCSVPAGMSCKARRSAAKTLLRWHCQDWEQQRLCKWLPVRYPLVTECACSC